MGNTHKYLKDRRKNTVRSVRCDVAKDYENAAVTHNVWPCASVLPYKAVRKVSKMRYDNWIT